MVSVDPLENLRRELAEFARERDWDQFHAPKNLVMALSVEVAELVEHFQWLTPEESRTLAGRKRAGVEEELADVLLYLVRIADQLDVDLWAAARRKILINKEKYPVDRVRGKALKYDEYED
ncbi:MAG: nucleotide pyrophosphohydrolase [Acidihalobacter sp.]|jgi:dCTP diphosphatase|uniref:nucleotide pyrophosphohydrolase n=1 Tax=Acidihalobacter sp. TaxID=1872108 RepID=UPI00307CF83C